VRQGRGSSSQYNFSAKPGGNTNTQTVTVKNSGPSALGTFSVVLTQPKEGSMYTVSSTGAVVSSNKSCQFKITFKSPSTVGTYTGAVTVGAQDLDGRVATKSAKLSGQSK